MLFYSRHSRHNRSNFASETSFHEKKGGNSFSTLNLNCDTECDGVKIKLAFFCSHEKAAL